MTTWRIGGKANVPPMLRRWWQIITIHRRRIEGDTTSASATRHPIRPSGRRSFGMV